MLVRVVTLSWHCEHITVTGVRPHTVLGLLLELVAVGLLFGLVCHGDSMGFVSVGGGRYGTASRCGRLSGAYRNIYFKISVTFLPFYL